MSIGHPSFSKDIGRQNWDAANQTPAQQQNALQNQMNPYSQGRMGGPGYQGSQSMNLPPLMPKPPEKKSMFKEIAADIKGFILEHRGVIYFIAFALILDHFFFRGAFKARLQSMAEKVVTKVEEKIK